MLAGIVSVARQHLRVTTEITPETPLVEGLQLDSIRLLTLVAEIENHFQIVLEEGDEAGLETVGDLIALIQAR